MATPTANPPSSNGIDDEARAKLIHNVSLGALIVCPLIIALPPRKFDIYTGMMLTGTFLGGNQLAYEYTGRSFLARCKARLEAVQNIAGGDGGLPEKAKIVKARLREEREMRERLQAGYVNPGSMVEERVGKDRGVLDEVRRKREENEEKEAGERNIVKKIWLGGEGEDWKAKRDQREREALEEGKGYGDLIMEQVWEVWNWGKNKTEDIKEKDEAAVKEKNEHQADGTEK